MTLIKKIEWTESRKGNEYVSYDHVIGTCPLGEFLICWKSWKENDSYDIMESPFGEGIDYTYDLEESKELCQKLLNEKILECLERDISEDKFDPHFHGACDSCEVLKSKEDL